MILDILRYPDPRLALVSVEVPEITADIRQLAQDMLETMYMAEGVGLAAPQVDRRIRMLVMDPRQPDGEKRPRVFVNPVLTPEGEEIISAGEGCLSVPLNYRADVPRASAVHVRAMDLDGNVIDEKLEGFPAIVIQHEVDHLEGRLFIDRISHLRRNMYDSKVRKWQKSRQ